MVHLILDFEPLSDAFQDVGNTIRAGEPQLRRIDVSVTGFLARVDLSLVELPLHHAFPETATPREEIASSCLSLEEEIDQFRLKEEEEVWEDPVEIPDSEGELDGALVARSPQLIISEVDSSSKEEEPMSLNPRKGLWDLMVGRNKGSSSKEAPKS